MAREQARDAEDAAREEVSNIDNLGYNLGRGEYTMIELPVLIFFISIALLGILTIVLTRRRPNH